MGRVIGYCRVSTEEQNLDIQEQAIQKYVEEKELKLILYLEKVSSRKVEIKVLEHAMKAEVKLYLIC